ncbi:MAG: GSCFA domain protein [Bacteroidetes bacterium]|nr:MAG: GSCFA domain protein [Bacteroidota bacterium]
MSEFRTRVKIPDFSFSIDHNHTVMCLGSCFAEHMFTRMEALKFRCLLNPYGILYNPAVIGKGITQLISGKSVSEEELKCQNGLWHSFAHHGRFSHPEKAIALENMQQEFETGKKFLEKTDRLLITLGSAWVYEEKSTGQIVANCHKFPANHFHKKLLTVEEVVQSLEAPLQQLKDQSPILEVILSVSPVRHIRDGLFENQQSKSTLILAIAQLTRQLDFVHYFPSYEIVLDELRDYRFYEEDMAHPNKLAVDYIWSCFSKVFFKDNTKKLINRIAKIVQASSHKPFYPETREHQQFLNQQLGKIEQIENEFPMLSFEKEIAIFKKNLMSS